MTKRKALFSSSIFGLLFCNAGTRRFIGRQLTFVGHEGEEQVYTDSMFCCSPNVVRTMVAFAQECPGLYGEETCIYGDFLASMGTLPADEKLYWREISVTSAVKRRIAEYFQDTRLDILVLEKSRFYHLGTMPECK